MIRYPGLKEGDAASVDPTRLVLGRPRRSIADRGRVVVAAPRRPGLYHRFENPLFARSAAGGEEHVHFVVLARRPERQRIDQMGPAARHRPRPAPVDSRSLVYESDLFVGAGGTMTREAALIGIPTLSAYAGSRPAVDAWLERRGALRRITSAEEIGPIERRRSEPKPLDELRHLGDPAIECFVEAVEGAIS